MVFFNFQLILIYFAFLPKYNYNRMDIASLLNEAADEIYHDEFEGYDEAGKSPVKVTDTSGLLKQAAKQIDKEEKIL